MEPKEPTCAFNLRKFPKALRTDLHAFAVMTGQQVQKIVPEWLREKLDEEKRKRQGKQAAKQK